MSSVAIFGGTFNPVHLGHRRLLEAALGAVSFDRLFVIPDRIPPHKQAEMLADGKDRLEMCRLAFGDLDGVVVSSWELEREGKSYSYYTVSHFAELYPDADIYFVMGSDMLLSFDRWYRADELVKMCIPLCISRCEEDTDAARKKAKELCGGRAVFIETELFEISSTELRNMLAERDEDRLKKYMDGRVIEYIRSNKLYGWE